MAHLRSSVLPVARLHLLVESIGLLSAAQGLCSALCQAAWLVELLRALQTQSSAQNHQLALNDDPVIVGSPQIGLERAASQRDYWDYYR